MNNNSDSRSLLVGEAVLFINNEIVDREPFIAWYNSLVDKR